jgi:hypothetical protein
LAALIKPNTAGIATQFRTGQKHPLHPQAVGSPVTQIFILLYRRLAVGWVSDSPEHFGLAAISQIPNDSKSAIRQNAALHYADVDRRPLAGAGKKELHLQ